MRAAPTCSNNQSVTVDFRNQGGSVLPLPAYASTENGVGMYIRSSTLTPVRWGGSGNYYYYGYVEAISATLWKYGLFKLVNGVTTTLKAATNLSTQSMPTCIRLRAVGTTLYLDATWDGTNWTNQTTITDTSIASGANAGFDGANQLFEGSHAALAIGAVTIDT
jgi:type III secretory pathway component EscS